jgi:hypothetical protein
MLGTLTAAYIGTSRKGPRASFAKAALIGVGVDVLLGAGLYALAKNKQVMVSRNNEPMLRLDGNPWPNQGTQNAGLLVARPVESFGGLSAVGLGYNMARSLSRPRAVYRGGSYGNQLGCVTCR